MTWHDEICTYNDDDGGDLDDDDGDVDGDDDGDDIDDDDNSHLDEGRIYLCCYVFLSCVSMLISFKVMEFKI